MSRVVLAMSGGVDSSVAAYLLRRAGHEVIGVFMRHGEAVPATCSTTTCSTTAASEGGNPPTASTAPAAVLPIVNTSLAHKQGCCTASDAQDARRIADSLGIPFYAIDFQEEFGQIIDYFIAEYTAARTPNPCVVCNNWLKFGKLFDYADSVGADFVATGHYARIVPTADGPALCRGVDESKDQAYVLFGIERRLLDRMLLPVGDFRKDRIRALAREMGLRVADKPDSQEICFVPAGDHAEFIRSRRGASTTAGEIVLTDGRVVGHHEGLERYTIGQRKGLGVALGEPRFVIRLEPDTHRVVLGTKEDLACWRFTAGGTNWLVQEPASPLRCSVKIRYNSRPAAAKIEALPGRRLQVEMDEPQYGVAPGQAVVCFEGDRVLGGGWIEGAGAPAVGEAS